MVKILTDILEQDHNFLQDSLEFEAWICNIEASIIFKTKSLKDWNTLLNIPTITNNQELSNIELEMLNHRALNMVEIVMSNLAIAKSGYFSAKANHELDMIRVRKNIQTEYSTTNRKLPSNENLEKLCLLECMRSYKLFVMSEIIQEFWNVQSYKLNQYNTRLTSLNISKRN